MNNLTPITNSQTATGGLAFAVFGAAMAAIHPVWPENETPSYVVVQTDRSYSQLSEHLISAAKQNPHADFASDMAAIYASLSERQERLGEEFEAAIFSDLDSLYES